VPYRHILNSLNFYIAVDEAKPPVVLGANIMTVTSNIDNLPAMNEIVDTPLLKRHYTAKINFTGTIDVFSM
jgi:hypothetical protein